MAVNVINNVTNRIYGATLNFKTQPVKPTVTTLGVTNATTTAATCREP